MTVMQKIAFVASVSMPLFNIPLILRMIRTRSSQDISIAWVIGVMVCIVAMVPASLISPDPIFKAMTLTNLVLFSGVTITVVYFRLKK